MRKVFAVAALALALPFLTSAQAGFPDKPLWLSNAKPVAGDEISLSTILYNGTDAAVAGTLTFLVDDAALPSQEVSLAAQSSSVFSAKWTARAGAHSVNAKFTAASGSAATLQQTNVVRITVAEPPPPSALQQSAQRAAAVAGQIASSSAPFLQEVAQAVFAQTEALRNAGIEYLEKKLDAPRAGGQSTNANVKGFVLGTSTKQAAAASGSTLHRIGQAAAAAGLFVLRSFYLFYPILAFLFLFALYIAAKKLRRPHSH